MTGALGPRGGGNDRGRAGLHQLFLKRRQVCARDLLCARKPRTVMLDFQPRCRPRRKLHGCDRERDRRRPGHGACVFRKRQQFRRRQAGDRPCQQRQGHHYPGARRRCSAQRRIRLPVCDAAVDRSIRRLGSSDRAIGQVDRGHQEQAFAAAKLADTVSAVDEARSRIFRGLRWSRRDHAIVDYNEAIEGRSDAVDFYKARGNAYYAKQDYDHAIADFNEAIRLDPNNAVAFNGRGIAYYAKLDNDRAIADCGDSQESRQRVLFEARLRPGAFRLQ